MLLKIWIEFKTKKKKKKKRWSQSSEWPQPWHPFRRPQHSQPNIEFTKLIRVNTRFGLLWCCYQCGVHCANEKWTDLVLVMEHLYSLISVSFGGSEQRLTKKRKEKKKEHDKWTDDWVSSDRKMHVPLTRDLDFAYYKLAASPGASVTSFIGKIGIM